MNVCFRVFQILQVVTFGQIDLVTLISQAWSSKELHQVRVHTFVFKGLLRFKRVFKHSTTQSIIAQPLFTVQDFEWLARAIDEVTGFGSSIPPCRYHA